MDYCIDTTPFVDPVISGYVAPFQPRSFKQTSSGRKALMEQTSFVTAGPNCVDFFTVAIGSLAPTTSPISNSEPTAEPTLTLDESVHCHAGTAIAPSQNEEIDQIAKQRVRLMAAKYVRGGQSSEIMARLEILNSRLSERAPRVSNEQVAALEAANDQLARIRGAREERAKRLGIATEL